MVLKVSLVLLFFVFYILLFVVNPFLTYYSFEARSYSLFAFLATLSYYSFYKKSYKVYFFATVLGLYTHYFMLFVLLSQAFFNFLVSKKSHGYEAIKKIFLEPLLIFLPWFFIVLVAKNFFASSFWIAKITLKTLVDLLGILYTGYDGGLPSYSGRITLISITILLLLTTLVKMRNKKYELGSHLLLYLSLWAIGVPLLIFFISLAKPIFFPRYFIFSTVGFLLFLIYLLDQAKIGIRILALIILFAVVFYFQKTQIQYDRKRDFQKIAREVKVLAKKDDLIYVTSELDFFTAKYYFPTGRIYIYNKSYDEIPDFVGKVLISKNDIATSLPYYPKKAFVLSSDGTYSIQALY